MVTSMAAGPEVVDAPSQPPVLVLRAIGLGDALTGVPALRGLRRLVAPRPVLLAAPEHLGRWFTDLALVDGWVATADLDAEPPGRGLGRHDAVDLHGNGPASRDLLAAGSPQRLLAWWPPPGPGGGWRAEEHEVRRWCRLVGAWGAACDVGDLRLRPRPARPGDGPVVLHPGAASGSRRWPVRRWVQVARALVCDGHDVVVTGTSGEAALCAQVVEGAGLGRPADLVGALDLPALAGLVVRSRLVVCGDTGVAHLATALAVPSVLLFGPVAPSVWGPVIDLDLHTVLWEGDGCGDPHGAVPDPHLLLITVPQVLAAAAHHLQRWAPVAEPGSRAAAVRR